MIEAAAEALVLAVLLAASGFCFWVAFGGAEPFLEGEGTDYWRGIGLRTSRWVWRVDFYRYETRNFLVRDRGLSLWVGRYAMLAQRRRPLAGAEGRA